MLLNPRLCLLFELFIVQFFIQIVQTVEVATLDLQSLFINLHKNLNNISLTIEKV